jgi:hypothetical protein
MYWTAKIENGGKERRTPQKLLALKSGKCLATIPHKKNEIITNTKELVTAGQ